MNGAFQRTQTWSINEYGEEAYMWLTRIYLIDKDFLIFYFYFESFDFLIWWYDLKRNIIWKAIKDNLSLKRISLLFYFILYLFYNKNKPSLLSKDQTQHNHWENLFLQYTFKDVFKASLQSHYKTIRSI